MNTDHIKILLDSCFTAKRITEMMKALPEGIKPRHILVIECVYTLSEGKKEVRVSA